MINQELSSNFNKHVEAMGILKNKILDENERIETEEKTSLNLNIQLEPLQNSCDEIYDSFCVFKDIFGLCLGNFTPQQCDFEPEFLFNKLKTDA